MLHILVQCLRLPGQTVFINPRLLYIHYFFIKSFDAFQQRGFSYNENSLFFVHQIVYFHTNLLFPLAQISYNENSLFSTQRTIHYYNRDYFSSQIFQTFVQERNILFLLSRRRTRVVNDVEGKIALIVIARRFSFPSFHAFNPSGRIRMTRVTQGIILSIYSRQCTNQRAPASNMLVRRSNRHWWMEYLYGDTNVYDTIANERRL